jgi:ubiquinone/menaquinone biosynthesis C-methylase UbiE
MRTEIKYDSIGTGYNATRRADPYLTERLLYHLQPQPEGHYLDMGCGTGNYTIALAGDGYKFTGIDPSMQMLAEARMRTAEVNWRMGSSEQIPAEDNEFNGIIAVLTIHHWTDLAKSFAGISRVLAPGGRLVVFTSTPEQMKGYWLNHYFPEMLRASVTQMPSLHTIQEAMKGTGLVISGIEKYFVMDNLEDCFLYVGKNNPSRYFDERVRHGISSFAALSHADEVAAGLSSLRKDMESGEFGHIREQYANGSGDYLFLVIEKNQ